MLVEIASLFKAVSQLPKNPTEKYFNHVIHIINVLLKSYYTIWQSFGQLSTEMDILSNLRLQSDSGNCIRHYVTLHKNSFYC